ncbi:peroxisomal membrane protein PEX13 [Diachasmimorpha longicaudata]|uniref:peroxisomal membrane protein PEX13 n=1 Tax=Diachasmimorpha longicaudata TaxID=58733 RepID=UPI0030B888B4
MNQQRPCTSQFRQTPGVLSGGTPYAPAMAVSQPPPLPPRRITNSYQSYGGYRPGFVGGYGGYNSYGFGSNLGYGGSYGGYGSYGNSYGSPYGNFGHPSGDVENRFVQFAEESTRPAFQSIESIVHTFSSVTMMLESTFFAMTSSFKAILSVADNVGRVRNMFGQLLSTFALIRFLKWLYRKIMFQLGLRPDDPNSDAVWQKTVLEVANGEKTGPSTWPILIFLGLLVGIPYLIHKLVSQNIPQNTINQNDPKEWFKCKEPVFSATAAYDFTAATPEEMSLRAGQKVWLAPESLQPKNLPGWSKATDSVNVGLIPSNYVTLVGLLKKKAEVETLKIPEVEENMKEDKSLDESFPDINETDGTNTQSLPEES